MSVLVAPSILSADPMGLRESLRTVEEAGADMLHIDIMDGHFVPNLTFGPHILAALRKATSLPLEVHLMVERPREFVPLFHEAGADWISLHIEASTHLHKDISLIKELGRKAGVALNPATPIHFLNDILKDVDFLLVMCVNPGWGSQKFIPSCLEKIRHLRQWIRGKNLDIPIAVDGGVNLENAEDLVKAGTTILVAGSAVFNSENPGDVVRRMKAISSPTEQG